MCQKLYAVVDTKDGYYFSFAHNDWFDNLLVEGCLTSNRIKAEDVANEHPRRRVNIYELKQVR